MPRGMAHQVIVALHVDAPVVSGRQHRRLVRRGDDSPETLAVGVAKTIYMPLERHHGDQPQSRQSVAAGEHRFGSGHVESCGHAAQKRAAALGVEGLDCALQGSRRLAAVGAVARESDGGCGVGIHRR